jgi:D-alanine-D-alanine ligase
METVNVLVLFGGRSSEHAISCISAGSILSAIDTGTYTPIPVGITRDGDWFHYTGDPASLALADGRLPEVDAVGDRVHLSLSPGRRGVWLEEPGGGRRWQSVDVVFPVLHGPYGEDGAIQGALEVAGLPYVGSGVFASAACMDKGHTKRLLESAGIPAGRWHAFHHRDWGQQEHVAAVEALGWPLFVKPARAGSSVGVSKVHDEHALKEAIDTAGGHDPHLVVEASVEAALEIECGVLVGPDGVPRASTCAQIVVREGHDFYDFDAKYLDDSVDLVVPAAIADDVAARIRALAVSAFRAMDCEGLARVDFFVAADGSVCVNEINTMPGFTPISMYPQMWAESGVDYPELIDTLIREALHRRPGLR